MSIRNFFSTAGGELSPAVIIRRVLFMLLLLGLSFFYLVLDFSGLANPLGVEQAQISRNLARAQGFVTQCVRPASLYQAHNHADTNEDVVREGVIGFHDTYHAPLNPLLNSLALKFFRGEDDWKGKPDTKVYYLDRVIAGVSMLLLLCSIGVSYMLVSRIFDAKIGGVTALLMLLCELLWEFSQTGLPQMLMLFLFSFILYFLYKAIEAQEAEQSPMVWLCLVAGFFGLLALAHWMAIWLFMGLALFVSFYFRPRGILTLVMVLIFVPIIATWSGFHLLRYSGSFLGSGYFSMMGAGGAAESIIMRSYQAHQDMDVQGLPTKILMTSISQLNGLYSFLGSILVAPFFFISLLHPFKRREISSFRWGILLMWIFAVIGMSLFGLPEGMLDPNQMHILFMPIMTGYGLALLAVLWSRLGIVSTMPMITNGHLVIVVLISALPLVMTLPKDIQYGLNAKEMQTSSMELTVAQDQIKEAEVVVTDVPWNVAWYADRTAVWLPSTVAQLNAIEKFTAGRNQPVAGILLTLETSNANLLGEVMYGQYKEWAPLVLWSAMLSDFYGKSATFLNNGMLLRPGDSTRQPRPPAMTGVLYDTLDMRIFSRRMYFFSTAERAAMP